MPDQPGDRGGFTARVGEPAGGRITVTLRGDLDHAAAARLEAALDRVPAHPDLEVWVDLQGVAFIDSGGLRALFDARHRFPDRLFVRAEGRARDLLEITGAVRFLAVR